MTYIVYKAKVTRTAKLISLSLAGIVMFFIWVISYFFEKYILKSIGLKMSFLSLTITGGFLLIIFLLVLLSVSLFIPAEYVLTDDALLIRRFFIAKYAEQKIPYNQIEKIFLYTSWDFRGKERRFVLIKRYGKLNVNFLNPTSGSLMYLYLDNYHDFLSDISSLSKVPCICSESDVLQVTQIDLSTGKEFSSPFLMLILLALLVSFLLLSPALLVLVHI